MFCSAGGGGYLCHFDSNIPQGAGFESKIGLGGGGGVWIGVLWPVGVIRGWKGVIWVFVHRILVP